MTCKLPTLLAAVACSMAVLAAAQTMPTTPAPANPREVWDLSRLFPDDAAWDAARSAFAAEIPVLEASRGTLGRDAASLRNALDRISAATQRLQRLWVYASTQSSTDTREQRNQARSAQMYSLWGRYSAALSWVDPELQAIGAEKLAAFERAEPGLARHRQRLRDVVRRAPHTLSPDAEAVYAALGPLINAPGNTRTMLVDADAAWPSISVDGKSVKLNDVGYQELRQHPDRAVRKQVFDTFFKAYGRYENTLGALLAARVESGTINARLRKYPSALAASLAVNDIPEAVVRTLVAETNLGLPALHRYFKLRQKLLALPDLHYYDVYPDTVKNDRRWPVDESAAITLASTAPLGDEYQQTLRNALALRSMHVRPAEGKSSGAYATGVYGVGTFVFLNHTDSYDSLTTFAHEWGHGMHTLLAQRAQPFETAGYSLYLAEIASITNEVLLSNHLLKGAKTKQERLFLLDQVLERMRGSFFRQAMFAEFELAAHDAHQKGEPLNGKRFTQMYCALLRKYHGADAGVMTIDPQYCQEWSFIPHFQRPFYVFAYATSTAAAYHFGRQLLDGKPGVRDNYLAVLRAGSSAYPDEVLKGAGLDLASPEPYRALIRQMGAVIDEMERLIADG